ncbi:MAG: lactonase family protein, partial [Candidatus Korobacteraceae bacterium]
ETSSAVAVFEVNAGRLKQVQELSTLPADYKGRNSTAEILIDAAGKFVYVSNRGHDSLAVFSVDPKSGMLTYVRNVSSGGRTPRNMSFDPSGEFLFASNQGSNDVVVFRVDPRTGDLKPTGTKLEISTPGSVQFIRAR